MAQDIRAVDALTHPNPGACARAGIAAVGCYLRNTTRADVDRYHAAGVGVWLIDELGNGTSPWGGRFAGEREGLARLHDLARLGAPPGVTVFATMDADTAPSRYAACVEYQRAYGAQLARGGYPHGLYGPSRLVQHVHDRTGARAWQAGGWRYGFDAPAAVLVQLVGNHMVGGTVTDANLTPHGIDAIGAWMPPNYQPSTQPTPLEDETMAAIVRVWVTDGVPGDHYRHDGLGWRIIPSPEALGDLIHLGVVAGALTPDGLDYPSVQLPNGENPAEDDLWRRWPVLDGPHQRGPED